MKDENHMRKLSELYENIFNNASDGILIAAIENKKFHMGNKMICEMLGYSLDEIKKMGIMDVHPEGSLPHVIEQFDKMARQGIALARDIPVKRKDGSIFYADIKSFPITLTDRSYIVGIFRDTTERKVQAENIQEVNSALKVLLKRREEDIKELEEKVLLNVKELVIPYLEKLKISQLDQRQKMYLRIMESNLIQLTSPFSHKLVFKFINFTPTEIQVADMLRQGKTNKEISELMRCSMRTIAFHRENIRKKLQLRKKKVNLKSYLLSLVE